KYSKIWSSFFVVGFALILIYTCSFINRFWQHNELGAFLVLLSFDAFLFIILLNALKKYLIPALRGEIALELNKEGIIDKIKNRKFYWKEINSIDLLWLKNGAYMEISLVDETTKKGSLKYYLKMTFKYFNSSTLISLFFIEGNNVNIFQQCHKYFYDLKNHY
ncbi:MAG TPA: hypothetical protein PKI86_07750, partial [Chitinophagales bacterium]|nr:hypothetical protein [Chitinophagales bacterium]